MSTEANFRELFAQLRLEHFLVYLPANGWQSNGEAPGGQVRFELPDDEAPYVLLLPKHAESPQRGKLLQRAIYNLCGIEDRQPAELIHDLLAVDTSGLIAAGQSAAASGEPVAVAGDAVPVRLRLRNDHNVSLAVQLKNRDASHSLLPGEAMEVVYHPSEGDMIEINFQGSAVQIDNRAED